MPKRRAGSNPVPGTIAPDLRKSGNKEADGLKEQPPAAKAELLSAVCGTTEVVPFPNPKVAAVLLGLDRVQAQVNCPTCDYQDHGSRNRA